MTDDYRVKGSTLNSKRGYVREHFGESSEKTFTERLREAGGARIFDSGWYPYELYVRSLQILAELHFGGDISKLVEVGRFSANKALQETYRSFITTQGFVEFLKHIGTLHRMFYSAGSMEVVVGDDVRSCEIVHHDKPRSATEDHYVALGFYLGAGQMHGHSAIRGRFDARPGAETRFYLSW